MPAFLSVREMFPDGANEEQAGTGLEEREREKISFWR
jgi:hypothetical protein